MVNPVIPLKHLMMLYFEVQFFFMASFYTLSKTLIRCSAMKILFKVETLLNYAFKTINQ